MLCSFVVHILNIILFFVFVCSHDTVKMSDTHLKTGLNVSIGRDMELSSSSLMDVSSYLELIRDSSVIHLGSSSGFLA